MMAARDPRAVPTILRVAERGCNLLLDQYRMVGKAGDQALRRSAFQ
jgi:hypothetical protein